MRSSRFAALVLALAAGTLPRGAAAQVPYAGFAVERFYPSAPGGGWFLSDALDMQGGLGGAIGLTIGYARDPLRLTSGAQSVAPVTDQAFGEIGIAATYDRFRLSLRVNTPIV